MVMRRLLTWWFQFTTNREGDESKFCLSKFPLMELPEDVLVNILSRLPLSNILDLQTVCKNWLHLTSSPYFAEAHFRNGGVSLIPKRGDLDLYICDHDNANKPLRKLVKVMPNGYVKVIAAGSPKLVGSWNGLLVFQMSSGSRFLVWNLLTREQTYIDAPELALSLSAIYFHSLTKEYRLLFSIKVSSDPHDYLHDFFIYGLNSMSWRKLATSCYPPTFKFEYNVGLPTLYNGNLHWMSPYPADDRDNIQPCGSSVVIFDTEAETFRCVPHPGDGDECNFWRVAHGQMYFFESDGQLYFVYNNLKMVVIWSLKDYKNWQWVRIHEFQPKCIVNKIEREVSTPYKHFFHLGQLVCIEGDNELVFRCAFRGLFRYDWEKRELTNLDKTSRKNGGSHMFTYARGW